MTIIWASGGETGDLSETGGTSSGTITADATTKYAGAYSYRMGTGSWAESKTGFNLTTAWARFRINWAQVTPVANTTLVAFVNSSDSAIAGLRWSASRTLDLYNQSTGSVVVVANSAAVIPTSGWTLIEFQVIVDPTVGQIALYINGVADQIIRNLTTNGAGNIDRLLWGPTGSATTSDTYFDDFLVSTTQVGAGQNIRVPLKSGTPTYDTWTKTSTIDVDWSNVPSSAANNAKATSSAIGAQTALLNTAAVPLGSGDTVNAAKIAIFGKTDGTDAAGIAIVGTAQGGSSTTGVDITLTFDGTPKAGDIVIVTGGHILRTGTNYGPSTAGYTAIGSLQTSGASGTGIAFGAWYKILGSSPDATVVCQGSGTTGDGAAYTSRVLRQADATTPLDVSAVFAGPTTSTNPDPPAIVPTSNNCAIVIGAASLVSDTNIGGATSYTGQGTGNSAATRPYSTSSLHRILSGGSGSSTDPAAIGSTGNTWSSGIWFSVSIAIRPTTQAGSAASIRRRLAASDTDTAITLTTSDAYYETAYFTPSVADLSSGEIGVLHGSTSLTQQVEDAYLLVDYTPSPFTWSRQESGQQDFTPHMIARSEMVAY